MAAIGSLVVNRSRVAGAATCVCIVAASAYYRPRAVVPLRSKLAMDMVPLYEIASVRQVAGEHRRRWFTSSSILNWVSCDFLRWVARLLERVTPVIRTISLKQVVA